MKSKLKLVFASNNVHKAHEVAAMIDPKSITLLTLAHFPDMAEPPEDFDTFEANALAKARYVFERTGLPTIADDSGLEVYALNGRPGVHSKRYSPQATAQANNALLLQELAGQGDRRARFRCVLALVNADFEGHVQGICEGEIAQSACGADGFGYDPLFLAHALPGQTLAQVSLSQKNAISHRGHAFALLPSLLLRAGLSAATSTSP